MTALAPEITSHGLALWRLKRSSTRHIRCLVGRFSGKLVLAIHSDGKVLVASLLRTSFLSWTKLRQ
jgi:hypothetical protein